MANVSVFFSNLQTGCSSSTVLFKPVAPFFREDINISRGGDLMGVDMFLLDSQVSYLTLPFVHKQGYFTGL